MIIYTVTVTSACCDANNYMPRTAVFSTEKQANAFVKDLNQLFRSHGAQWDYIITKDVGTVDERMYLEIFETEFEEEEIV